MTKQKRGATTKRNRSTISDQQGYFEARIWLPRGFIVQRYKSKRINIMMSEKDVLDALDKPRALYSLKQLVDPSSKSSDALHALLVRMRADGKVMFDIKTGKWGRPR